MTLQKVSGTDVMNIGGRPMVWVPDDDAPWNPMCDSTLALATAESLLDPTGIKCTACLKPVLSSSSSSS